MCINYIAINKIIFKTQDSLPMIDDLLDRLQHVKYFTKLDLKLGYHQVQVKEEDAQNTILKTR